MGKQWTPPSDAVVENKGTQTQGWTPPSDAVPVKKKSSGILGLAEKATDMSLDLPQTSKETKPSESSGSKKNGIYETPDNPNALYKKENGQWFIDVNKTGKFQPLSKGDVAQREKALEKNAKRYFDADYEQNASLQFQEAPKQNVKRAEATPQQQSAQQSFEKDFGILDENDPIVKERNKIDRISKAASKAVFMSEESAVDALRKSFSGSDYDIFDFQEYGAGDKMRIENKMTGQHIIIDLDNSTGRDAENERKLLEAFIDVNLEFPEHNKLVKRQSELVQELQSPVGRQRWEVEKELDEVRGKIAVEESKRRGYALGEGDHAAAVVYQKYDRAAHRSNQTVIKDDISSVSVDAMRLKQRHEENQKYKAQIAADLKSGALTPEQYAEKLQDPLFTFEDEQIKKEYQDIQNKVLVITEKANSNDQLAAQAYNAMKERGDVTSAVIGSFVKGFTSIPRLGIELQRIKEGRPDDAYEEDFYSESLTGLLPGELTEEYINNPDLPGWEKALIGISESLGAALSTGPMGGVGLLENTAAQGFKQLIVSQGVKKAAWETTKSFLKKGLTPDQIGLFSNSFMNFKDQMNSDPAFDDVPESEKITLAATYGFVSGQLERFGLTKSLSKSPMGKNLTAYLMKKTFTQLPKNASAEAVEAALNTNIKSLITQGVLNTGSAAFIEGSTEAAQEIADMSLKEVYNTIKGKDYFENPKTFAEALDRTTEAFKLGMIGGAMMNGTSQTLQTPKQIRTALQLNTLEATINNPEIKEIFQNDLKIKVLTKEISPANAKAQLRELDESQALFEKIPDTVKDPKIKHESFRLLAEKQRLETEIEGRDPSLASAQIERVKQIDEQLTKISQDAVQKQTAGESVLRAEQPEVGLQEVVQGNQKPESVTKEDVVQQESVTKEETVTPKESTSIGIIAREAINRPATLGEFGGRKLSTPLDGDVYIDGGQVVFEEKSSGRIYELGAFNNISDSEIPGLITQKERVAITPDGKVDVDGKKWNIQSELPTQGVEYNPVGDVYRVSLKDDVGNTVMFDGQDAVDIAYQIELQKYQTPKQQELINDLLEQDEEFKRETEFIKPSKTSTTPEEEAITDIETIDSEVKFEDVKSLDVTDKTNLQRVQSFMNGVDKNLDKFGKETLGVNLPLVVAKAVVKTIKTLVDAGVTLEQAIKQASNKHNVATKDIEDTIKTIQQQAIKQRLKEAESISKPKKVSDASRAAKNISKKPKKMIVIDEAKALVDQIKLEAKAAMGKKKQVSEVLKSISDSVKEMQTKGKITVRQASSIVSALKSVNLDNKVSISRFENYVQNIFEKAEFAQKQSDAAGVRKTIKRSFKGKSNPFVAVAKGFSEINPKWVEDIDDYLDIAEKVKKSLRPTVIRQGIPTFKEEADIREVGSYTAKEQQRQDEITAENIKVNYEKITGESAGNKSAGDMLSELNNIEVDESGKMSSEEVEAQARELLEYKLDEYKKSIPEDAPTEVKEAVKINPDYLKVKEIVKIIDALDSYMVNESTAGLRAQMAVYKGVYNAKKSKVQFSKLKLAGNKYLGEQQGKKFSSLKNLTERMTKGVQAALEFRKESGIDDLVNAPTKAETKTLGKQDEYLRKFAVKKKLGVTVKDKDFNSAESIYTRGALAFLTRNLTEGDQEAEFNRRKDLLLQSAKTLEGGNTQEQNKAKVYREVLDKIGASDAKSTIADIKKKAGKSNEDALDFGIDMFSEIYPDLSDFALGFYNKLLSRDTNYTPDKFSYLEDKGSLQEKVDAGSSGMSTFNNTVFDKNSAGVLVETKKPKRLPAGSYIDLDFDSNLFRSYRLALTDMYMAESIEQVDAYLKSVEISEKMDKRDLQILKSALSDFIKTKKGKNFSDKDSNDYFDKLMNYLGALAAGRALGQATQAIKQSVPATLNGFFQTGFNMHLGDLTNKDVQAVINNSGRGISNRGIESVTTIDRTDGMIDKAVLGNKYVKFLPDLIAKANEVQLKYFLVKPDVATARLMWAAFYRKSLRKQGLKTVFDPNNINEKAADYAQAMVDRNMDVSDPDLRGDLFHKPTGKHSDWVKFVKMVYFPFASFAINQKNRMWNDISVITSKLSSREDKAIAGRSLGGLFTEILVFNAIRYTIGRLIIEATMEAFGLNDDEKEEILKQYDKNNLSNTIGKTVQDIFSPSPALDQSTLRLGNYIMETTGVNKTDETEFLKEIEAENEKRYNNYQDPLTDAQIEDLRIKFHEKEDVHFYINNEADFGTLGIFYDKAMGAYEFEEAWRKGKYMQGGDYPTEKYLTKEGQDKMFFPTLLKVGAALFLPAEADQFANRSFKIIKEKYGLTENQSENVKDMEKLGVDINDDTMKFIKSKKAGRMTTENLQSELEYINSLSESEKKKYLKELGI